MNRFNQIYYAAVVFVFVIEYASQQEIYEAPKHDDKQHIVQPFDPETFHLLFPEVIVNNDGFYQMRMKRGLFWSNNDDDDDDKKDTTTKSTITAAVNAVDGAITTTTTTTTNMAATTDDVKTVEVGSVDAVQSDEMHVVSIGEDVERSLMVAAPYLPLVNKLVTHLVPSMSRYDVVTLSVNVAALAAQGYESYARGQSSSTETKPDGGTTFGNYATGIYGKLKNAFESHFGPVPNLFVDGETTEIPAQTDSIFDKMKSKIYIVHNYIKGYDSPETETNKNKIETIVTKTYIEGSQLPDTADMIVTKTYESGAETLNRLTNGETNHAEIATKLIEDGKNAGKKITQNKNSNESNESDANEDIEAYDDEDEAGNMSADEIEIKEEDFNKVLQESMDLQPDFIKTLSGDELMKHIDELQNSFTKSDIDSIKVFWAITETFYFDDNVSEDQVIELVNALGKITNYFISTAIENKGLLTTPPMN